MKVKVFLLTLLIAATSLTVISKEGDPRKGGGVKVQQLIIPVFTFIEDTDVYVFFNKDIGVVDINIKNEYSNIVYSKTVNTETEQELMINISNLPAGTYTFTVEGNENQVYTYELFTLE